MKEEIITTTVILFLFSSMLYGFGVLDNQKENLYTQLGNLELSTDLKENKRLAGLYQNGIFCLTLEDMTYSEVIKVCNHEYLHYQDTLGKYGDDNCHFKSTGGCS